MKKDLPSIEDVVKEIKRSVVGIDEIECFDTEVRKKGSEYTVFVSGYIDREIVIDDGTEHYGLIEKLARIVGETLYLDRVECYDTDGTWVELDYGKFEIETKWNDSNE